MRLLTSNWRPATGDWEMSREIRFPRIAEIPGRPCEVIKRPSVWEKPLSQKIPLARQPKWTSHPLIKISAASRTGRGGERNQRRNPASRGSKARARYSGEIDFSFASIGFNVISETLTCL